MTLRWRPDLPDRCPQAVLEPDGRSCSIGISWFRPRKTGPAFPLAVCRCPEHAIAFTAYPPGFGPYLRQPVIAVGPAGEPLLDDQAKAGGPSAAGTGECAVAPGIGEFEGTVFDAALSAAGGVAWARASDPGGAEVPDCWWSTQGRKLEFSGGLVGIASDLGDELRVRIAHVLRIPVTRLLVLSRGLTGYRSRGQAIITVLGQLRRSSRLAFDLLSCAWLIGRFGRPLWWIQGRGFHPVAFSRPAMPAGP